MNEKRDQAWLHALLDRTWDSYFADVPQDNIVRIKFGRRTKRRLGSISVDPSESDVSVITLNGLFADANIPEMVVEATLVHELSHYAHGFNSPLNRVYAHPHAGGVMRAEFKARGLEDLYTAQKKWLKENWPNIVSENFAARTSRPRRSSSLRVPTPRWFLG